MWDKVRLCAAIHLVTIYGKTESVYIQKFHCSINGTLSSGKLPESLTYKYVVCAYFANSFVDQSVQISRMKTRYFPAMALCIRHEPLPSSISATDPTRCIKKDHTLKTLPSLLQAVKDFLPYMYFKEFCTGCVVGVY